MSELDRILRQARHDRDNHEAEPSQEQLVRDGLMHFFQPVYDLMDGLHRQGIKLLGQATIARPIQSGTALKESTLQLGAAPQAVIPLDASTQLVILITTKRGLRYPEIIAQAKWRCRLDSLTGGGELDSRLIDNRGTLLKYVVQVVTQYEVTTEVPNLLPPATPPAPPGLDAPATRENRVIMLDDDLNEETT